MSLTNFWTVDVSRILNGTWAASLEENWQPSCQHLFWLDWKSAEPISWPHENWIMWWSPAQSQKEHNNKLNSHSHLNNEDEEVENIWQMHKQCLIEQSNQLINHSEHTQSHHSTHKLQPHDAWAEQHTQMLGNRMLILILSTSNHEFNLKSLCCIRISMTPYSCFWNEPMCWNGAT